MVSKRHFVASLFLWPVAIMRLFKKKICEYLKESINIFTIQTYTTNLNNYFLYKYNIFFVLPLPLYQTFYPAQLLPLKVLIKLSFSRQQEKKYVFL